MQLFSVHFQPFRWRCQASAWLWNLESGKLKEVSGWQRDKHEPVSSSEVLVPSAFLAHFVFFRPCQSWNCSSICDYWGAGRGCGRTFLFPPQTTDCTPVEPSKSIRTIFCYWMTEVFLADCREQGPGKVRKSIMCVHLCFSLKQTLTACWTAWPCWHFIFHLASSINHSTPIQCDARGHPSLLALIIPLRRKMYSRGRNRGGERARRTPRLRCCMRCIWAIQIKKEVSDTEKDLDCRE